MAGFIVPRIANGYHYHAKVERAGRPTLSQRRQLRRMAAGEQLRTATHRNATFTALARKGLAVAAGAFWTITPNGRQAIAPRPRPAR